MKGRPSLVSNRKILTQPSNEHRCPIEPPICLRIASRSDVTDTSWPVAFRVSIVDIKVNGALIATALPTQCRLIQDYRYSGLRVEQSTTTGLGGLDRLAVDNPGRWTGITAGDFARLHDQGVVDGFPQPFIPPAVKVALHR